MVHTQLKRSFTHNLAPIHYSIEELSTKAKKNKMLSCRYTMFTLQVNQLLRNQKRRVLRRKQISLLYNILLKRQFLSLI